MRLSLCMCTMNERGAIAATINAVREALPGHDIEFVITDSSTDGTAEIAEGMGARVIRQAPKGYGVALRESLMNASGDIVLTTDCDGTYPAGEFPRMVAMMGGGYDVVSGSRLKGRGRVKSMKLLNELGNRLFALMVSVLYGFECTDATTGMRAYRREVVQGIEWTENTGLSLELLFKPAALGYRVAEVPIGYSERVGTVKLNPWRGGLEMLVTILRCRVAPMRRRNATCPEPSG